MHDDEDILRGVVERGVGYAEAPQRAPHAVEALRVHLVEHEGPERRGRRGEVCRVGEGEGAYEGRFSMRARSPAGSVEESSAVC